MNLVNLETRAAHLFKTGRMSDCEFFVGCSHEKKLINAHKLILAMSSPVFESMFYGSLATDGIPIEIDDIEPKIFNALLEYIYLDAFQLDSFEDACSFYYAAKKYMLNDAVAKVMDCMKKFISNENACTAYEFGKLHEDKLIIEDSMKIITQNTSAILKSENFLTIEPSTLLYILDQNQLNIQSEMDLCIAIEKYAVNRGLHIEESSGDGSVKAQNLQKYDDIIHKALKKVRFLTVTPKIFASSEIVKKLLSTDDAYAILVALTLGNDNIPDEYSRIRNSRTKANSHW